MVDEPQEAEEWWMDARTRQVVEQALDLQETLTITVYEARPLHLTRAQVGALSRCQLLNLCQ